MVNQSKVVDRLVGNGTQMGSMVGDVGGDQGESGIFRGTGG